MGETGGRSKANPTTGAPEDEEIQAGGGSTSVVRRGDTVHRSRGPHSEKVSQLLTYLADVGFLGAPRFLGIDEKDRDVFRYIHGTVGNYPLSAEIRSTESLVTAARLLRIYHDATAPVAALLQGGGSFGTALQRR